MIRIVGRVGTDRRATVSGVAISFSASGYRYPTATYP